MEARAATTAALLKTTRTFHECSIEEKIQRLNESLQIIARQSTVLGEVAAKAHFLAENHEHVQNRGLMVPAFAHSPNWAESPMKRVLDILR